MKKNQIFFILFISFASLYSNVSLELGRYDGGEYCYRILGASSGRMYPDQEEMKIISQMYDRSSDRPGQVASCGCQIEQQEIVVPDWNNRFMDDEVNER